MYVSIVHNVLVYTYDCTHSIFSAIGEIMQFCSKAAT